MTDEELDAMKYKICCPMCDNYKCVRGTEKCEAELWKKRRMKQMTNELSVEDAIELLKEKRMEINYQVNGTTQFSEALDMAIKALEQQPIIDKIRVEIEALSNANPSYWHSGDMVDRDDVLEILDKYIEGSEENDE